MPPREAPRRATILIVDARRTFAEALAMAISKEPDLRARATTPGDESERAVADDQPDLVVLDIAMPGYDGVAGAARLLSLAPGLRLLALCGHDDDVLRTRAVEVGVCGFVSMCEPMHVVLDAIRRAVIGERVPRRVRGGHIPRRVPHATERQRSERLSPRERQILQLMVDGKEPPEIAHDLGISPATLRTHMQNILTKLGVHSKTQAVLAAMRQGMVDASR